MKELVEKFLKIEHYFANLTINDFYVWPYIRTEVFRLLESDITNNNFVPVFVRQNVVDVSKSKTPDSEKSEYENDLFEKLEQKLIIILTEENRFVEIDGKRVCPITSPFSKMFSGKSLTVCNRFLTGNAEQNNGFDRLDKSIKSGVLVLNYGLISAKNEATISANEIEELSSSIQEKLEKLLNVKLKANFKKSVHEMINYVCSYREYSWFYGKILEKVKPKVIIVSSYYCMPHSLFIAEAKKREITVIEMQHGTIGNEHMAYNSYLNMMDFPNTPEYLLCYGTNEQSNMRFSIDKNKIVPIGNLFLNEVSNKYKGQHNRIPGSILFVNFNIENDKLIELALEIKRKNSGRRIIYRFHPVEVPSESLVKKLISEGIEISKDFSVSVYEYLAVTETVIGTKTTVLKEAEIFENIIYKLDENSDIELLADDIISEKYEYAQQEDEKYYTINGENVAEKLIGEYISR